ncbi:thermonuclease family protein [Luteolibacter sp. Populi]|uniref:thermonuclease family protein n=1 Tax=Luteolibacter sp. Populi TaxID=3230487 RepID=UPI003466E245
MFIVSGLAWLLGKAGLLDDLVKTESWPKTPPAGKIETRDTGKTGAYQKFSGCRYEEHRQNDGDSFRVLLPDGRVEQFRLYFVDCPESQFRTYSGGADNHERIHEQALYFGISDKQAVEIGARAKARVHELLGKGSFTLHTRWEDPFGDQRYHAFILPSGGPGLDETLVREGLARIHTKGAELPDGIPTKARQAQLRELEGQAKKAKRGAWAMR